MENNDKILRLSNLQTTKELSRRKNKRTYCRWNNTITNC